MELVQVGDSAPDFELLDSGGNSVKLTDFRGKYVVVVFYRLDFSPV